MSLKNCFKTFSIAMLLLASSPLHAERIAAGDSHNLVARGDGAQYAWGANDAGQLADDSTLDALNPIEVRDIRYRPLAGAIAVASYGNNNMVLLDNATLLAWGPNENGQLGSGVLYGGKIKGDAPLDNGDGTDPPPEAPASAALPFPDKVVDPDGNPIENIVSIALGANFTAAVNQAGNVLVWGNNLDVFKDTEKEREPANRYRDKYLDPTIDFIDSRYKDGDPVVNSSLIYMRDEQGNRYSGIIKVAVGDSHLLALTNTGQVLAWGENSAGQLADGTLRQRPYPVFVQNRQRALLTNIGDIAARGTTSIAVSYDGRLLGWGATTVVTPFNSTTSNSATRPDEPYADPLSDNDGKLITGIRRIALGDSHLLGLTTDGRVKGWGNNSNGQLGDGTNSSVTGTASVVIANGQQLGNIIEIAVGSSHSLALRGDGYVYSWGSSENGRLGDGTNVDSYYAINVRNRYNGPFSLFGVY